MSQKIRERERRIVEFDSSKRTAAIASAGKATGEFWKTARKNVDLVENYIRKLDWKVKENSNMSYSLQGLNNFISSDVTSQYWLNRIYPLQIRHAHESGDIHIHDLSMLSAYCVGWDLKDLLKQGFKGVGGKIESGPPKHLSSALGQVVNFFYTLQGEAAGAQAVSNFDTLLAPFVHYDNLDYKQLKQAFQEFVFNMNIPTRVGFQTPFTNITMDLQVSPILKHCPVIIGGTERKETYSDFQSEMNLINRAFAEVMMEGDARSMCCRLRLDNRELLKRGGGLFGANPLTGSIGVVTINLPRIGYLSKMRMTFLNASSRAESFGVLFRVSDSWKTTSTQ